MMEFTDYLKRLIAVDSLLGRSLEGISSLEKILEWMARSDIPLDSIDLITQDEYCHDLLIPLNGNKRWLVFGLT